MNTQKQKNSSDWFEAVPEARNVHSIFIYAGSNQKICRCFCCCYLSRSPQHLWSRSVMPRITISCLLLYIYRGGACCFLSPTKIAHFFLYKITINTIFACIAHVIWCLIFPFEYRVQLVCDLCVFCLCHAHSNGFTGFVFIIIIFAGATIADYHISISVHLAFFGSLLRRRRKMCIKKIGDKNKLITQMEIQMNTKELLWVILVVVCCFD